MGCEGKVAVVTGAAGSGMGRSIALTLARAGAHVVANYRTSRESAGALVQHLEEQGSGAVAVQADVFTPEGYQQLVRSAVQQDGQVDICVVGPGAGWHPQAIEALEPAAALIETTSRPRTSPGGLPFSALRAEDSSPDVSCRTCSASSASRSLTGSVRRLAERCLRL
jgi:NAD(P)-dependent dehydrogenase (short-subunit alcohol dehydrogenase family)